MDAVIKMLEKAKQEKLWGNLQIDFHNGEIVLVRKTETTKIGTENTRHEHRTSR
jgi:ribosomal protein S1